MKIKQIFLENIRSYENQEINFAEGSTLLSGDIGSGKTSILLAVEFALFGLQPGQRGTALLRNGKREGKVKIVFEIDNNEIIIERTLKKGKTISQDYCSLIINNEKKEMSVTELKGKILELLKYPPEFAKKQNILYKFTVYTPQEEMKQIILEDPETRINTLRHVFGIDKYKRMLENVSIITIKLREERNKFQSEIEKTKIMILNKNETVFSNNKTILQIKSQIAELQQIKFDETQIKHLEQKIIINRQEKEKFNQISLDIGSKINSFNLKIEENKKLEKKISNLEICPTCLQNVDAVYKANVLNKINADEVDIAKQLQILESETKEITEKLKNINEEIFSAEN